MLVAHALAVVAPPARLLALGLLLGASGCGGDDDGDGGEADAPGDDDTGDDSDDDGDGSTDGDGGAACASWRLVPSSAPIEALDADPGPYNPDRTIRLMVHTRLDDCEARAIPRVVIDAEAAAMRVDLMVWSETEGSCTGEAQTIIRPVAVRFPRPGSWKITAGDKSIDLEIEAAPERACGAAGEPCSMDCDCADGERCLSDHGFAGPFTECARPCELDRDCGGDGHCESLPDGLSFSCVGAAECGATAPDCADGWTCTDESCAADFTLDETSRHECECDADCDEPLRCVRGGEDEPGRCEIACPTEGPWCQGAHACGTAAMDAAGLATTDSVCVWLGE